MTMPPARQNWIGSRDLETMLDLSDFAIERLHSGLLNDEIRVLARHPAIDEREQDALREDHPAGELQVSEHSVGTHLEPTQDLAHLDGIVDLGPGQLLVAVLGRGAAGHA